MTTIEKIRVEIERQIKDPQEHCYGVSSVNKLRELLSFLDTLESEKPMEQEMWEKDFDNECHRYFNGMTPEQFLNTPNTDIARHFYELGCRRTAEKYDEIEYKRQLAEENDEVVINGHKVAYDKDKDAITMEEIQNDLEEAAEKFARLYDQRTCDGIAQDCFIAGAKWDRKKMMNGAVEGRVYDFRRIKEIGYSSAKIEFDKIPELDDGDKVRVIVCKKEEE